MQQTSLSQLPSSVQQQMLDLSCGVMIEVMFTTSKSSFLHALELMLLMCASKYRPCVWRRREAVGWSKR